MADADFFLGNVFNYCKFVCCMMIDLPFYENDGKRCLQACGRTIVKYFLGRDYSLDEFDEMTGRKEDKWTNTSQLVNALANLGLRVKLFSKERIDGSLEGEPYYRRTYGENADKILDHTDIAVVNRSILELMRKDVFELKKLSFEEIEGFVSERCGVIVLIDNNKITGKNDLYQGHFVVMTGFDEKFVYYHNSGPKNSEANKKVEKNLFIEAINANGTDNDCIVVFGKK